MNCVLHCMFVLRELVGGKNWEVRHTLASNPGAEGGGGKSAWYPLFAHACT